jgi:DNA-binding LytR/AlgR family response regulator
MITCIAIDDEPLALDLLASYIFRVPDLQLKGTYTDQYKAADFLKDKPVDLLFLDIEMPDMSGIQFYKSLNKPPMVIFTTAYSQYAVDGFNLEAIDYLLKPIEFERFQRAVDKAKEYQQFLALAQNESHDYLFVKSDYQLVKINFSDIDYIEGLDDYVKIYGGGKAGLSLMSMKSILQKLPFKQFVRVHRSYIVSLAKIESIQRNRIKIGSKLIPISDNYSGDFYSKIDA